MTRTSTGFLAFLAAVLLTVSPAIASQAQVVTIDPATGLVSVESTGMPLQALLEQMSAATPFALLRLEPAIRERPVHVSIRAVSVKEAVIKILTVAGAGFVISGPENGNGLRVAAARDEFVQTGATSVETAQASADRADESRVKPDDAAAEVASDEAAVKTRQDRDSNSEAREQLVRALTGNGFAATERGSASVLLPFPAAGGGAVTAIRATPGSIIELPFPGPGGAPVTAVVPPRGIPVQLPVVASPPPTLKVAPKSETSGPKNDKP
jgi:hypothetical protein